ncbi:hypothetical protein EUTSA_v10022422mg [Eutrema salsugineum]|uniref:SART-1 family protein n=1 Tax=Eutrema salsugineum TaxID=72664 RepID=V4M155_EUTSA|nr:SART-1 family protein DOT2 [Eutrema salsugineum]ESQ48507.1 hypothetical protein EUTSA_v10022422mg [Eutrema salsugineum]
MSQLNIALKKNTMRKNKKLVINIAPKKEGLASRLEADQELGSSRFDEKKRLESSERRRDVVQRVCSKAEEINDRPSARDGVMREVEVGTGLFGALKLLREQGTFKEKRKLVGVRANNHEDDRFRDAFKDIRIDRVDEHGRILSTKEAYRALCHQFHGKKPGARKQEKRKRKHEDNPKHIEFAYRAVQRLRQIHAELKSPYIVL